MILFTGSQIPPSIQIELLPPAQSVVLTFLIPESL
ncbi:MAG: hypothetical protein ACI9G9_000846 [Psychromonas sp.]|jgi:hypothetical protein